MDPKLPSWLSVRNGSSVPGYQWAGLRDILLRELRKSPQAWRAGDSAPQKIEITFSENVSHFLWIVEISRGEDRDVVMSAVDRSKQDDNSTPEFPSQIEVRRVFRQTAPILDLALVDDILFVLDPAGVSSYRRSDLAWQIAGSLVLSDASGTGPLPRDPRGRLWMQRNSPSHAFRAYLPGFTCAGAFSPPRVQCLKEDEMWPVELGWASFNGQRNYFDGQIQTSGGDSGRVPSFFSMAKVQVRAGALWMFAGLDGNTYLYDGALRARGTIEFWSSDLAAITSDCGRNSQVLSVQRVDADGVSMVQAFELTNRQPVAASSAVEISGSITAFRPLVAQAGVLAVASQAGPRHYAAYLLSLTCQP